MNQSGLGLRSCTGSGWGIGARIRVRVRVRVRVKVRVRVRVRVPTCSLSSSTLYSSMAPVCSIFFLSSSTNFFSALVLFVSFSCQIEMREGE